MPSLLNGMNVTLGRAALKARTYSENDQGVRGGVGVGGYLEKCKLESGLVGGARDKMSGKMGVPVPAAKQLLQGSSSPLNLSHLLLVFRHWSHAKESK